MQTKNDNDILKIFDDFQKMIEHKPSFDKMFEEVQMMRFKVHPVAGDIGAFDLKNSHLIETLWSLGKLDELFQKEYRRLSSRQKIFFYRLFESLYQKFQGQLNRINLKQEKISDTDLFLEIEIFKEHYLRKRLN